MRYNTILGFDVPMYFLLIVNKRHTIGDVLHDIPDASDVSGREALMVEIAEVLDRADLHCRCTVQGSGHRVPCR